MKPPAGLPNTCPKPRGSVCGWRMAANTVSLVPMLTTAVPGSVAPIPTKLDGLSPVKATTGVPRLKPYFFTKYSAISPICVREATAGGSFSASPGAVAATSSGLHVPLASSSRFMPAPSPWSIGALPPIKSEPRNELTRWISRVFA